MAMSSETGEGAGIERHESEAADPDTDEQHVRHGMPPLQFGQGLATGIATGGIKIPCGFEERNGGDKSRPPDRPCPRVRIASGHEKVAKLIASGPDFLTLGRESIAIPNDVPEN